MIELSIDNETYAVTHDAVVLTVGAVLFEGMEIISSCHLALPVQEQIDGGRRVLASTIEWWIEQGYSAKKGLQMAHKTTRDEARAVLRKMGSQARRVWARPAMFDLPMLRSLLGQDLWDDENPKRPNHGYQKENDLGTLVQEFDPDRQFCGAFVGVPHNALDDAIHHWRWLNNIRDVLSQRGAYYPKTTGGQIWTCKIGEFDGQFIAPADPPMREAVERAYKEITGQDAKFAFSGWGGYLDSGEREVVDSMLRQRLQREASNGQA